FPLEIRSCFAAKIPDRDFRRSFWMDLRCTQPDLYRSPQRSQEKPDPSRRQRTGKIPAWSDRSDTSRSSQQTPGLNRSSRVYIELNSIQQLNQMTATSATRERLVQ